MTIQLDKSIGKNFCYAPWTNMHINPQGEYKTCCAGTENFGDLRVSSIESLTKSRKLIEIKKTILENQEHTNCDICIRQELNTANSERSWYNDIAEFRSIDIDSVTDYRLQNLDIRWSITCNLSCVYCDAWASSQWATHKKIPISRLDYTDTMPGILDFIEKNKQTLKNLALLGGEPLLQKENEQLLDVIDADVYINVITNLSMPLENNKIFKKLLTKNRVMWDVSFETVEEKFEYVRHGASWLTVVKNIRLLKELIKDKPGHSVGITGQYSVYNAMDLATVHEKLRDYQILNIRWNELHNPYLLSVVSLPQRFIDRAINQLEKSVPFHDMETQKKFLIDMAAALGKVESTAINCDSLYKWHFDQEQQYWPDFPLKFANLWPEYQE